VSSRRGRRSGPRRRRQSPSAASPTGRPSRGHSTQAARSIARSSAASRPCADRFRAVRSGSACSSPCPTPAAGSCPQRDASRSWTSTAVAPAGASARQRRVRLPPDDGRAGPRLSPGHQRRSPQPHRAGSAAAVPHPARLGRLRVARAADRRPGRPPAARRPGRLLTSGRRRERRLVGRARLLPGGSGGQCRRLAAAQRTP
jgi:hypothetical protein